MPEPETLGQPYFNALADVLISKWLDPANQGKIGKTIQGATEEAVKTLIVGLLRLGGPIALAIGRGMIEGENEASDVMDELAALGIEDLLGVKVGRGGASRRGGAGGRKGIGNEIGRAILTSVTGTTGALEPGTAAAEKYLGTMASFAIEGWLEGWTVELLSSLVPGVGNIETFGELDDIMASVMGFGRLSRRVLGPLITTTVVAPMEWHVNKAYRPTLLSAAQISRQLARGKWSQAQAIEELARQGYSDERIEALLATGAKAHSVPDYDLLIRAGAMEEGTAVAALTDSGYTAETAKRELFIERVKRIASFERAMADAAVAAHVAGRISEGELGGFITGATISPQEKAQYTELAIARRLLGQRELTSGEAEQAVKAGILNFIDYRAALRREGRTEDAIDVLDLLLRHDLDKAKDAAALRAQLAAERADEKKKRDAAAAARRAELEAKRALERRGREADLERAAIRGLIALDRVAEIYAAEFDDETAGILLELLEADRAAYVAQQTARDEAAKRGAVRGIDVGALEQAVLRNVITMDEYRAQLGDRGFSAGDVAVLAGTLQAKLDDLAAANAARDQAAKDAAVKHVSLSTIETLVRRGHRSIAEYDRTLADLGYDDGARAAMIDLLQDRIDEDAAARAAREAAANRRDARGLSLEQMRRAVLLGHTTEDAFQTYLVAENYTTEAQRVLLAALRADVVEADAARQRRADAEAKRAHLDAPLSDVARAARLGLIPVQAYVERLARAGYSDDAIALEVDLLVEELAAAADARAAREAAEAATRNRGLSLADAARSVRAGLSTIDAYVATVRAAGYSADAAATMGRLLEEELAAADAARVRREEIAAAARVRRLSLRQLEAAVLLGERTLDDYAAAVQSIGYDATDVALLVTLLGAQVERVQQAEGRRGAIAAAEPTREAALSALETAVLEGLVSMAGYLEELRSRGFGAGDGLLFDTDGRLVLAEGVDAPLDDTALLALLLQVRVDAAAAKGV
jgi:hypothetical protein